MKPLNTELIDKFALLQSNIHYVDYRPADLGRLDANGELETDITTDLPPNMVWVRFVGEDARGATAVRNLTTEYGAGMPVRVAYSVLDKEYQVVSIDAVRASHLLGAAARSLATPGKSAGTPTPVSAGDVIPGGLFADEGGGLVVRIAPTWTPFGAWWDGTELITLTPTATSGSKSFAVVGIQSDGTTIVTLSTDRPLAYPLVTLNRLPTIGGATDIESVTDGDTSVWWVGAVELANGDTNVNPAKIVDRRFWNLPSSTSGGGAGGVTIRTQTTLYETVLGSAGNFDQSGISGDYDTLIIEAEVRSSYAGTFDDAAIYFNNDTTAANYRYSQHYAGSAHGVSVGDTPASIDVVANSATSGYTTFLRLTIYNYAATGNKIARIEAVERRGSTEIYTLEYALHWENTAAITRVTFQPDGYSTDNFMTGSWWRIIGVADQAIGMTARVDDADLTPRAALNFLSGAGIAVTGADDAGNDESEISFALDIDGLTGASIDGAADYLPFHDASASGARKISINTLFASPPALGGTVAADGTFAALNTSGNAVFGAAGANTARLNVNGAASGIAAILRANATSPSDLMQMQNSTGFILSKFTSTGGLGLGVPNPQHFFQVNNAFATGTGTISSSGTAITGSGTIFNTELVIGATIYANGQARRVTSVGTNTAVVIDSAFSPDLSAGTTFIYNKPIFVMDQSTGNAGMGVAPAADVNLYLQGNMRVGGSGGGIVYIRTTTHSIYYNNPDMIYLINQASGAHRFKSNGIDRLYIYNGGAVTIYPQSASGVGLEVAGYSAAQSGNLVDFKTSAGVSLGSISAIGAATFAPRDAATNGITTALTLGHNTSATPVTSYGAAIQWQLESSTTESVSVGREVVQWNASTHASRSPDWALYLSDAGGEREIIRGRANGSAAALGFFGVTPVAQQTGGAATAGATYGATEQTMLQVVYDALRAFGLIS